jgi:Homing endonuclease associated repeat
VSTIRVQVMPRSADKKKACRSGVCASCGRHFQLPRGARGPFPKQCFDCKARPQPSPTVTMPCACGCGRLVERLVRYAKGNVFYEQACRAKFYNERVREARRTRCVDCGDDCYPRELTDYPRCAKCTNTSWSKQLVLDAIRHWNARWKRRPTPDEWKGSVTLEDYTYPSAGTVAVYFGSWKEGLRQAGVSGDSRRQGTGHLFIRRYKNEMWYGSWYVGGKEVKRSLGPKTGPGAISRLEAEDRLARKMKRYDEPPQPDRRGNVDRAYVHVRKALQEVDRVEDKSRGAERQHLRRVLAVLHEAEDELMRAMGRC